MTESHTALTLGQLIAKAKKEEDSGDIGNARKTLELALIKAEQSAGTLTISVEQTLETVAQFYMRRNMDEYAIRHWERLIDMTKRRSGPNYHQKLLPLMDNLAACHKRLEAHRTLEPILREALRLAELAGETKDLLAPRLERFADTLAIVQKLEESHAVRKRAKELQAPPAPPKVEQRPAHAAPSGAPLQAERKVFLGQLLMRSQLIQYAELNKQLQIAKRLGLPIGEVLISSGLLTEPQLEAALKLQSMTRENAVTLDQAAALLRTVVIDGVSIEEAMPQEQSDPNAVDNKLGSLLVDAGLLDDARLQQVLSERGSNALGKQLVLSRAVSAHIVGQALDLQEQIRDGAISRADAVAQLKKNLG